MSEEIHVEAVTGIPFGVGRVTVSELDAESADFAESVGCTLTDRNGRAVYPAFTRSRALAFSSVDEPLIGRTLTIYFLFRGDEPLELTLKVPKSRRIGVEPQRNPRDHAKLLRKWWRVYDTQSSQQERLADYPPIVETYLSSMLSKRLGLRSPLRSPADRRRSVSERTLEMMMGMERPRQELMRDLLTGKLQRIAPERGSFPSDSFPMPKEIEWPVCQVPNVFGDVKVGNVKVEPISNVVPKNCFYIRFGTFSNYLWLKRLLENNGGDIGRMITLRGHDALLNEKIEKQLGLRESLMARLLGDQVISDVALIGRDTFLREGAATGILFEAKNLGFLKRDLMQKRRAIMKSTPAAVESSIRIQGREVNYIHAPDNRMRSFLVTHGNYVLVTNSVNIAEGFLSAGDGKNSLGRSREFKYARSHSPVGDSDTAFVYLPIDFFKGLLSAHYQVELRRRLQAVTEIDLVNMARLAARAEQRNVTAVSQLSKLGLLPTLSTRTDNSRVVNRDNGIVDSLRGAQGYFTPVPDMTIDTINEYEQDELNELSALRDKKWGVISPVIITIQRNVKEELNDEGSQHETVNIELRIQPFKRDEFTPYVSLLGPPRKQRIAPVPGDVLSLQVVTQGGRIRPEIDSHLVFVGLQDTPPRGEIARGQILRAFQVFATAPAYFGTWPDAGWLDTKRLGIAPTKEANGMQRFPFGLWKSQHDQFSVLSLSRDMLDSVPSQLSLEPAEAACQVRLHVADLSKSRLGGWANQISYRRACDASNANARLLNAFSRQLQIPPAESLQIAERILGVRLVCGLGGKYELQNAGDELVYWQSTRANATRLSKHRAPLITWLRGLDAQVSVLDDRFVATMRLEIDQSANGIFNLFP